MASLSNIHSFIHSIFSFPSLSSFTNQPKPIRPNRKQKKFNKNLNYFKLCKFAKKNPLLFLFLYILIKVPCEKLSRKVEWMNSYPYDLTMKNKTVKTNKQNGGNFFILFILSRLKLRSIFNNDDDDCNVKIHSFIFFQLWIMIEWIIIILLFCFVNINLG